MPGGADFPKARRLRHMRIAVPIHSFEPGGVERVALRLAKRWQDDGERVVVVLGRGRGACMAEAPALDYRTLREPLPTDRWETLWMIWSLFQFLLVEEVDAVFCPGSTYTVVCVAMKLLLGPRCPPVLVKISNDLERRDMRAWQRACYGLWLKLQGFMLDRFVALAEPMRPEIENELAIPHRKVACVPDPALSEADLQQLAVGSARGRPANLCRFVSVGRLVPQKDYALMIAAFARHAWPGDTLVVAGEGPERPRLEKLVTELGLGDRVSLPGHVANVADLFAQADVFALSSAYEGVPAALLEALAAGLPIVATDCCASMGWLLGEGRFGVLAPQGDVDTFGAALARARHLTPCRDEMRAMAARFTLENSSQLYLAEFARVEGERRGQLRDAAATGLWDWRTRGV